jgi:hypothetical protein
MAPILHICRVCLVWGSDIYMSLWMHGFDISWHQRAGQIDIYMSVLGHNMSYASSRQGEGAGEGGALEGREGRSRSGCCAQSVRRTPRCVPCARRSPAPPPPALCALILGRDSLFAFSGCGCAGDSLASGTWRCRTLWDGAHGHFVGALCARCGAGRPAFNVCWCFPGADRLVLGVGVGSDSVLGG